MENTDEVLVEQLKAQLSTSGRATAFNAPEQSEEEPNPLETDFFKAMNAFRAARSANDPEAIARAEEHLRNVVRSELTGE